MINEQEKKLRQAILRGAELMVEHGLGDWTLQLQNKRTALADCHRGKKTIRYSKHFLKVANKEDFEGVTLHEITHALLPAGEHHGPAFVRKCIEISPNAKYARRSVNVPIFKFTITCPECGTTGSANRIKRSICAKCHREGKIVQFIFTENILKVTVW